MDCGQGRNFDVNEMDVMSVNISQKNLICGRKELNFLYYMISMSESLIEQTPLSNSTYLYYAWEHIALPSNHSTSWFTGAKFIWKVLLFCFSANTFSNTFLYFSANKTCQRILEWKFAIHDTLIGWNKLGMYFFVKNCFHWSKDEL